MSLRRVLEKQYDWSASDAELFSAFLLPMLHMDPNERATAKQGLKQEWIKEQSH
jgi:serine/threonine protein kinase